MSLARESHAHREVDPTNKKDSGESARSTTYHAGIADRLLRSLRKIERVQFKLKQRACVRQVIANNLNSDVRLGAAAVPSGRTP